MITNRVLALTALALLTVIVVAWYPRRQWKQPRVYLDVTPSKSSKQKSEASWTLDSFHSACPHMALVDLDKENSDYTISLFQFDDSEKPSGWGVDVTRRDDPVIVATEADAKFPSFTSALKESCRAIRTDVEDWAEFGLAKPPASVGRYVLSYHPTNFNRAFLLDTKTGAVWELQNESSVTPYGKIEYEKFNRISVAGLHTTGTEAEDTEARINRIETTDADKTKHLDEFQKRENEEYKRETDLDQR